ncbi:MAG: transcription elongation factor GreA [Bacteroidota bacterium]|jgi:transcription elongation factor GreA|nr:transcription elongation factor GreA [Bacteroidota bacterium]GDX47398.1 transcription elongation factor GreA [Bacteroidota bacterium]
MADIQYFTPEGLEKLKSELNELKTKGRSDVAKAIAEAREKGDLSENAEYDAAKDAQGMLEMKIAQLESTLSKARIIDKSKMDVNKIMILSSVKVKNLNTKQLAKFLLVSENEADIKSGKISVSSPIGKGLLGKMVGEIAEISVPAGIIKFEIIEISVGLE